MSNTRSKNGRGTKALMYLVVVSCAGWAAGCEPGPETRPLTSGETASPVFLRIKRIWTVEGGLMLATLVIANNTERPLLVKIPPGGVCYEVRQETLRPRPVMPNTYAVELNEMASGTIDMCEDDEVVLLGQRKGPGEMSDTSSYCENICLGAKEHLAKLGSGLRRQPPRVSVYLDYQRGASAARSADAAPIGDGQYQGIAIECDVPIDIYASELWKPGWRWEDQDIPCYPSSSRVRGCVLPPVP